jgi:hypothetical protein
MNYCYNCKYFYSSKNIGRIDEDAFCSHPNFSSLVTGKPIEQCRDLRLKDFKCGYSAKYFEESIVKKIE